MMHSKEAAKVMNKHGDILRGMHNDTKTDNVNHPEHYQTTKGLEAIDVIEAFTEDLTGIEAVATANVIKYILRWKKKNGLEDIKKAMWYLQLLLDRLDAEDTSNVEITKD